MMLYNTKKKNIFFFIKYLLFFCGFCRLEGTLDALLLYLKQGLSLTLELVW